MSRRQYRFLHFQPGIDWRDVNHELLSRLNRLGMQIHTVITVTSGYRSYAEQAALYQRYLHGGNIAAKPGQSNHERGLAVDAEINGTPIGKAIQPQALRRVGLQTPVKGDPVHVELLGAAAKQAAGKTPASSPGANAPAAAQAPVSATDTAPAAVGQAGAPGGPPAPETSVPTVFAPGSGGANDYAGNRIADTWQLIASQPLASPESQQFAQRALAASGG